MGPTSTMKMFVVLALAAAAVAEPEAAADAQLISAYGAYGAYGAYPYTTTYGAPSYTRSYGVYGGAYSSPLMSALSFSHIGKREAEADPALVYSNAYPYTTTYAAAAYPYSHVATLLGLTISRGQALHSLMAQVVRLVAGVHKEGRLEDNSAVVCLSMSSGFNDPEKVQHEEYTVTRLLKHDKFNPGRLDNDIAILYVDRDINLNSPYVNTACLPSCDNQFDYQFSNGTGVRCWVAGWGKNEFDGSFQFIQHKVDIPLVDSTTCNRKLKAALNNQRRGVGDRFTLSPSEICAGAEIGKDACTGDGGPPLVCQAKSGRWTVMGLVTWGVGCASDVPGVYARVSHFRNWINAN